MSNVREKGTVPFSGNFEPQKAAPLDARTTVPTYAILLQETTWLGLDATSYAYPGMQVSVWSDTPENNGMYVLTTLPVTEPTNWLKINASSGGGNTSFEVTTDESTGELIGTLTLS